MPKSDGWFRRGHGAARAVEFELRFWDKVAWTLEGWATRESPCWQWLGATVQNRGRSGRYGVIGLGGRRAGLGLAHRIAYELEREKIPGGLVLDHLCRNSLCVNPWHLEAVTQKENVRRGVRVKAGGHSV